MTAGNPATDAGTAVWPPAALRRAARCCALIGLGLILIPPRADAYWELVPDLRLNVIHETNPLYRRAVSDDATGGIVDGRLVGAYVTQTNRVSLTPRVRLARYGGSYTGFIDGEPQRLSNSSLDYDNYYLDLSVVHTGQRSQYGIAASWADTDVRSSEFFEATPSDPDGELPPESGAGILVVPDDRQQTWSLQPFLAFSLTERNSLNVSISLSGTDYDQENRATYLDYTFNSSQVFLVHALDQQSSARIGITSTSFTAKGEVDPTLRNESDSWGLSVGYDRTFSPVWSGAVTLGTSLSSVEIRGQSVPVPGSEFLLFPLACYPLACSVDDQNFVGNLTLRRRGQRTLVNFDLGRSIAPRSNGFTVIRNNARVFVEHAFTDRLTGSVALAYIDESSVAGITRLTRDYFTTDVNGRWRLSRTWWLFATYSYSSDETGVSGGDPSLVDRDRTNNRFLLGVQYRGTPIRR